MRNAEQIVGIALHSVATECLRGAENYDLQGIFCRHLGVIFGKPKYHPTGHTKAAGLSAQLRGCKLQSTHILWQIRL